MSGLQGEDLLGLQDLEATEAFTIRAAGIIGQEVTMTFEVAK
jgi:hypothetical protein